MICFEKGTYVYDKKVVTFNNKLKISNFQK